MFTGLLAPRLKLFTHLLIVALTLLLRRRSSVIYIMGDFNLNLLNSCDHLPTDDFLNTFYAYGFRPLIDKPTRITTHTPTLIDNILTNNTCEISSGILYSDLSDHFPLFQFTPVCFQNSPSSCKTYITRDINKNTINNFIS